MNFENLSRTNEPLSYFNKRLKEDGTMLSVVKNIHLIIGSALNNFKDTAVSVGLRNIPAHNKDADSVYRYGGYTEGVNLETALIKLDSSMVYTTQQDEVAEDVQMFSFQLLHQLSGVREELEKEKFDMPSGYKLAKQGLKTQISSYINQLRLNISDLSKN